MVNVLVDLFSNGSELLNAIGINQLQEIVDLLACSDLLNDIPKKLDDPMVIVEDAEEQAVEQAKRVVLNV